MNQDTRQKIKITYEKLKGAFEKVSFKEAHNYYLTLGNVREIHMIKKDATKSVFLGRLFDDENATMEVEAKKIWSTIENYFMSSTPVTTSTPVKEEVVASTPKRTRKKKVVEEVPVAQVEDVEVADDFNKDDDDYTWLDSVQ